MRRLIILTAVTLSACATQPDPAKVCTAEWIQPRADRAVERIERRAASAFAAIRDAGETWISGGTPGPIQMFRLSNAVKSLRKELSDGRGIRDLRTLASTCNDPNLIRSQVRTLLDRENVPPPIVRFMEDTGILAEIIESAEGSSRSDADG